MVVVMGPPEALRRPTGHSVAASHQAGRPATPAPSATPPAVTASHFGGPAIAAQASAPLLRAGAVNVSSPGFWSWALLDVRTGELTGSANRAATNDTASMVKAWIAADFLRVTAERGARPTEDDLELLRGMIRESDNEAAEAIYRRNGGTASIRRLIARCGLTDSRATPDYWSLTMLSARDAVRMGACIADGRAAGPQWTRWVLDEMRRVRGEGRFGIIQALPPPVAGRTAIKNGWLLRDDGQWRVNCLAIGDGWVLAVLLRYPGPLGMAHGASVCRQVAAQLIVT
jgi:hypothetical protein